MSGKKTVFLLISLVLIILAVIISIPDSEKKTNGRVVLADFRVEELEEIEFENQEGSWSLINTGSFKIKDSEKTNFVPVDMLIDKLIHFDGKIIDANVDKSIYGLEYPASKVTFIKKDGEEIVFYLGNKTPPGTEYYMADENGNVYTVYTEIGDAIQSERYEVEDSFILGIDYDNLSKIEVGGSLPFDLVRENDNWRMQCGDFQKEIPTDIMKQKVTRHFGGMYSLKSIQATEDNIKKYCSESVGDTVALYDKDGKVYTIKVGVIDNGRTYITVNDGNIIYCVIDDCFEFIRLFREEVY